MPGDIRWRYAQIKSWAVIGGAQVELVGFSVSYELNAIPSGVCYLPMGRDVATEAPAAIHQIVLGLVEQTPIEVWIMLVAADQSDQAIRSLGIPVGQPLRVAIGLTASGGYRRLPDAAAFAVPFNGLLVRLSQGSALSQTSSPTNPAQYSYSALNNDPKDVGNLNFTSITQANTFFTTTTVAADLWGKAAYPWFLNLAKRNGLWATTARGQRIQGDPTNIQVLAALQMLAPGGTWDVPARIQSRITLDLDAVTAIASDMALSTQSANFIANQTFWDILVGKFCPDYLLSVAPRVEDALVVPFLPGAQAPAFEQIRAEEQMALEIDKTTPRPLRGFGVLAGLASTTGALEETLTGAVLGIGGWYDAKKDGAVLIENGPRWMTSAIATAPLVPRLIGSDGKPIATAHKPMAAKPAGNVGRARTRAKATTKPLLDAYAQARFAQEVLRGRMAICSGPLRLDLAPGSRVEIEGSSEAFIADQDAFGMPHFAEIVRVTISVSAQAAATGTSFHLIHARTALENTSLNTSIPGHPLYQNTFAGAPLVDT